MGPQSTPLTLSEFVDLCERTGSTIPRWVEDALARQGGDIDADRLHAMAIEAGVPERYAWEPPDRSRNALLAEGTGYYLYGVSGDGKSTRAARMLKGWLAASLGTALWLRARDLFLEISDAYDGRGSEAEIMRRYGTCGLLVIDDLGKEGEGDWKLRVTFDLLDRRYGAHLPTIVTSQDSPGERAGLMAASGSPKTTQAMAGRMSETFRAIHCGDVDHRQRPGGED